MLNENEIIEIQNILEDMSWEEIQEALIQVEILAAKMQNKIVFSGYDNVQ
jgi:hypothetical protein